ncbi:MAG TPA: hypothetical protein VJM08_00740, partial [Anaerolineales bacterium]|nr:hypothetical protein [Anaerolineales bacterium]
ERFIGEKMSVLWESTSEVGECGWLMEGYAENYLRVKAFAVSPRWNEVDNVLLVEMIENGIKGDIIL